MKTTTSFKPSSEPCQSPFPIQIGVVFQTPCCSCKRCLVRPMWAFHFSIQLWLCFQTLVTCMAVLWQLIHVLNGIPEQDSSPVWWEYRRPELEESTCLPYKPAAKKNDVVSLSADDTFLPLIWCQIQIPDNIYLVFRSFPAMTRVAWTMNLQPFVFLERERARPIHSALAW